MAAIGELKPFLNEIARNLRILVKQACDNDADNDPIAGTSADNPVTIPAGYQTIVVHKTDASGTVDITFPDGSIYTLHANNEQFTISGSPLGEFTITLASGATYKYYAY
jgi:hypothetical protein